MTQVTEIAPDTYRISTFISEANLQFNQFLVLDDEPLLFHGHERALSACARCGRNPDRAIENPLVRL